MTVEGEVRRGAYFDSVTLMIAARDLNGRSGVEDAAVVMGTRENRSILKSAGLWLAVFEETGDTDLLLAVRACDPATAAAALRAAAERLHQGRGGREAAGTSRAVSLAGALRILPGANVALISVAGRYAADLASDALHAGLHVMIFSDNVPLEREIELKEYGRSKGLLVMGPDCGTAILNGVPLAFANAVARGDIGIVAAAGTGLQEVSSLISNHGGGISQAIGTGGRDVKREVGGIMFVEGLRALRDDPATRVIVLIAKPPHWTVLQRIADEVRIVDKPVIAAFLGADPELLAAQRMTPAATLEEAALIAVGKPSGDVDSELEVAIVAERAAAGRKYVRGLFSGGTFCAEAQTIFAGRAIPDLFSNVPLGDTRALDDPWNSRGHSLIDLGDDVFTVGRPHPMIDYSLRNRRILEEAKSAETAVILLDVVLGYGSNPDPLGELAPVIAEAAKQVTVACSVTGTPQDPQDQPKVAAGLLSAGARVFRSNAAAARFAARVACALGGRR